MQIVFCDSSTPNPGRFNVYAELKRVLVDSGIPSHEVAFIHDAKNDKAKDELFAKCRKGDIRVLIGSTEKCGAGTNIQDRLAALHHLDCPFRPRDIEQRQGRIIRKGNMYKEVAIFSYVSERSFDSYLWHIITTKQRFISQIRQGSSGQRSFEDKDETLLSFEAVQAIASGNPLIMEKINLDNRISQLHLLLADYQSQRYRLQDQIEVHLPAKKAGLVNEIEKLSGDLSLTASRRTDEFTMLINGKVYTGREEAGGALIELARNRLEPGGTLSVGEYMGLGVEMVHEPRGNAAFVRLTGSGVYLAELNEASAVGTATRIDNLVKDIPERLKRAKAELMQIEKSLAVAIAELNRPFEYAQELAQGIERQTELNVLLNLEGKAEEESVSEKEKNGEASQDTDPKHESVITSRICMSEYAMAHADELESGL